MEGPPLSHSQQPTLRIVFIATTRGNLWPCKSCSIFASGGMDRRATVIRALRAQDDATLYIAGPYEFFPDSSEEADTALSPAAQTDRESRLGRTPGQDRAIHLEANRRRAEQALAAQKSLPPDAGWLSQPAAAWFQTHTGNLPPAFTLVKEEPVSLLVSKGFWKVGLVFFPEGRGEKKTPDKEQVRQVLLAGSSLKNKADMVIGVSPWGFGAEQDFLKDADGTYSLILGGGPGVGFSHTSSQIAPSVLWSRSDTGGRSLNTIELYGLPGGQEPYPWLSGISFQARQEALGPDIPPDPAMRGILEAGQP